jgi:hypothetical protein
MATSTPGWSQGDTLQVNTAPKSPLSANLFDDGPRKLPFIPNIPRRCQKDPVNNGLILAVVTFGILIGHVCIQSVLLAKIDILLIVINGFYFRVGIAWGSKLECE